MTSIERVAGICQKLQNVRYSSDGDFTIKLHVESTRRICAEAHDLILEQHRMLEKHAEAVNHEKLGRELMELVRGYVRGGR